jgi:hypothetical protein
LHNNASLILKPKSMVAQPNESRITEAIRQA